MLLCTTEAYNVEVRDRRIDARSTNRLFRSSLYSRLAVPSTLARLLTGRTAEESDNYEMTAFTDATDSDFFDDETASIL